jgi:hypothetical protein
MLIVIQVTNYLFMPAMYQQIATFGKMTPCAATHKFSTKDHYQNDLDIVVCKFIYRCSQRNAVPGYAAFS